MDGSSRGRKKNGSWAVKPKENTKDEKKIQQWIRLESPTNFITVIIHLTTCNYRPFRNMIFNRNGTDKLTMESNSFASPTWNLTIFYNVSAYKTVVTKRYTFKKKRPSCNCSSNKKRKIRKPFECAILNFVIENLDQKIFKNRDTRIYLITST